jgi:uncharacterized protein
MFAAGCDGDRVSALRDADPIPPHPEADAASPGPDAERHLGFLDYDCQGQPGRPRVLVYTYENLWRHLSNWYARVAITGMCETHGFAMQATNDPRAINATRLANIDVVVFSVTSGSALSKESKADLEAWVRHGGGIIGFEAAAATEMDWTFFEENLGAKFKGHGPDAYRASVHIDTTHPITQGLPPDWKIKEQWYVFTNRPEQVPGLHVLMWLDEATLPEDYPSELLVGPHPIGWAYEPFGGRVFYTGLGDAVETFEDPIMLELIARAIEWTARKI